MAKIKPEKKKSSYRSKPAIIIICLLIIGVAILSIHIQRDTSRKRAEANKKLQDIFAAANISDYVHGTLVAQKTNTNCGWRDESVETEILQFNYSCHSLNIIWVGTNKEKKELALLVDNTAKNSNWHTNDNIPWLLKLEGDDPWLHITYDKASTRMEFLMDGAKAIANSPRKSITYYGLGNPIVDAAQSGKYKYIYMVKVD